MRKSQHPKPAAREQTATTKHMAEAHLRTLEEDLRTRLLLHYESRWDSPEMLDARKRLATALLAHLERGTAFPYEDIEDTVPNFFESLGVLLRRGNLDIEMVWHIFSYDAMRYAHELGEFWVLDRNKQGEHDLWEDYEYFVSVQGRPDSAGHHPPLVLSKYMRRGMKRLGCLPDDATS